MKVEIKEKIKREVSRQIKKCCLENGIFRGHKKTIIRTNGERYPWVIMHQCDLFGKSSEFYENLDDAVYDFVELWAVYG